MLHFDHALVFAHKGAPEARALEAAGFRIGARREHPGQGTANACCLFQNGMLELIWIADEAAARSPLVQPIGLWERSRWRELGTCPLGIAVRTATADEPPEFAHWDYAPAFLPPGQVIRMACNSGVVNEPLLLAVPGSRPPPDPGLPFAGSRVTAVRVTVRELAPASLLRDVALQSVTFDDGEQHLLELELDQGRAGRTLDLGPELPVRLRW